MSDIEIVKLDQGGVNARILARQAKVDFRRVEGASLKMPTRFTSAEGKRSFVRMFNTLQLNTHFIAVIARTRLDHDDIGRIEATLRAQLDTVSANLNQAIDGLPREILAAILDTAAPFTEVAEREVKKLPLLRGKSVFNLFFENSTRTRTTFEIAAKRLSADVINLNISTSSTAKGETLLDTVDNLCAMQADMFVVRHAASGAPFLIAQHLAAMGLEHIHVINAGDGRHAHPTQGLLDMYTIRHYKKDFTGLTVAIIGDLLHSRVARSQIHALTALGVPELRVIGPKTLIPTDVAQLGVRVFHDMRAGLKDVDVVMMLRLQNERMQGALLPSPQEFFKYYGLTADKLECARPDAIVMHPGPMNRGVEIDSAVADGPHAVILPQVTFGIAVRMAVMSMLAGN